jgi:hypothetical protein
VSRASAATARYVVGRGQTKARPLLKLGFLQASVMGVLESLKRPRLGNAAIVSAQTEPRHIQRARTLNLYTRALVAGRPYPSAGVLT